MQIYQKEFVIQRVQKYIIIPDDIPHSMFFFTPPEQYEVMLFAENIDVNSASGISGLNTAVCKTLLTYAG